MLIALTHFPDGEARTTDVKKKSPPSLSSTNLRFIFESNPEANFRIHLPGNCWPNSENLSQEYGIHGKSKNPARRQQNQRQ